MRVLKWIVDRANGRAFGVENPIGLVPRYEDIDWGGLKNFSRKKFQELMTVDREDWKREILSHEELFIKLYDKLPKEFIFIRELTLSSLWRSPESWDVVSE